MDQTEEKELN